MTPVADGRRRPLRVAVEARALELKRPRSTGIGNYLTGVVGALGQIDAVNRYVLVTIGRPQDSVTALATAPNVGARSVRLPRRAFGWLQRRHRLPPLDLLVPRADVFLFTNYATYPLRRTPFVSIVYDLSFLLVPETLNDGFRRRLARGVPRTLERAASVVTLSEAVKRELVEHLSVPAEKVVVAPPGVDRTVFPRVPAAERAAVRRRLGLPDRYFLFVGTLEPRKNLLRLLLAYDRLPPALRARQALVLVGMKGWRDDEILAEVERQRSRGAPIHRTGYVAAGDLPALYSGATALVWPSLYEGFGMPILEAMACGAPVITADRSAMPEAAGGAALLVDPTDVDALSTAMLRVAEDAELNDELAGRGLLRAASADWHHTADRVRHALELAAGDGPRRA